MHNGYKVIDADGHVMENVIRWEEVLPDRLKRFAPRIIPGDLPAPYAQFFQGEMHFRRFPDWEIENNDRFQYMNEKGVGMTDPQRRLKDMDEEGIDIAVLFGGGSINYGGIENPELGVAMSRIYNDWLAEYCRAAPDRLKGLAALPLQDMDAAISELRRAVKELGFVGAAIPSNLWGKNPGHRMFYPVYAEAERLGVPVCVHPIVWCTRAVTHAIYNRGDNYYVNHILAQPVELMIAFCSLLASDVLETFPRLRFLLVEGNVGWLPAIVGRAEGLKPWFENRVCSKLPAREYLKQQRIGISCDPDEIALAPAVELLGPEGIMYASDYWHWDATFPGGVDELVKNERISRDDKRRILADNAAVFFNLG